MLLEYRSLPIHHAVHEKCGFCGRSADFEAFAAVPESYFAEVIQEEP